MTTAFKILTRIVACVAIIISSFAAKAQTNYCFVIITDNCPSNGTFSNIFELRGNDVNLSQDEIGKKFIAYYNKTINCHDFFSVEVRISANYDELKQLYDQAFTGRQQIWPDTKYKKLEGFSFYNDAPSNKAPAKKYFFIHMNNTACGNKNLVISNILSSDFKECGKMNIKFNFIKFYNKYYSRSLNCDLAEALESVDYPTYDAALENWNKQIAFDKNLGYTVQQIEDFRGLCNYAAEYSVQNNSNKDAQHNNKTVAPTTLSQNQDLAKEKAAAAKFLAENKKKPGVITTASGLQYIATRMGNGIKPTDQDTIVCHFIGSLTNGKEFENTYKRGKPSVFAVNGVIEGWIEALKLMPKGSKWKLFVPSELAHGDNNAGTIIPGGAVTIYDVELVDVRAKNRENNLLVQKEDITGAWNFTITWPSAPNLAAVSGKMTFAIDADGSIKGSSISAPNQRLNINDTFTKGTLVNNKISFNVQGPVYEIIQAYELTVINTNQIKGTIKNTRIKPMPDRPESWDIPAEIELHR